MKRKEYRVRQSVLLSFEKDRWDDFVDLCDNEHKSTSLKINELVEKELQKKAIGQRNNEQLNPLNLPTMLDSNNIYDIAANKPFQSDLTHWFEVVDQTDSHSALSMYKGQALEIARRADRRSMELRKQGVR